MPSSVLIIAEIGSVHDGSFGNAMKLVGLAKECGADAVKFQTHIASAETLRDAPMPPFFKGEPRYEYFERTGFSLNEWKSLKQHCDEMKIEFLSSPFSIEAVELLETIGIQRYKVPSGEITNTPLLKRIAATNKPVLLSSGMSDWNELDLAVNTIREMHHRISILQCTTEYPCPYEHCGLNVLGEIRERYQLPIGLSDHTLTIFAPIAAVTLGASIIEKHLTFSRSMYGSDARHSLEPSEFRMMAEGIRAVEIMISHTVNKGEIERFRPMKRIFEKSIVALSDIKAGTKITSEMIGCKKPGNGIPATQFYEIVGKKTVKNISADSLILETDIEV